MGRAIHYAVELGDACMTAYTCVCSRAEKAEGRPSAGYQKAIRVGMRNATQISAGGRASLDATVHHCKLSLCKLIGNIQELVTM